ncbi:MAG: response regulator transcription factor, partial [Anaerolineales bacterium]
MNTEKIISVLIADDHAVVRDGIIARLDAEPKIQVIASASDGIEAIEMAEKHDPDVILLDLVMPRMDGIQAIIEIKKANSEAKILVLTSYAESHQVYSAIKSGAMG